MIWRWILVVCLVLATEPTVAQDQPKAITTVRVKQAPASTAMYKIETDGTVEIDWDAVETLASSKADRTMSPFAEVMLAIRDKTWKVMH